MKKVLGALILMLFLFSLSVSSNKEQAVNTISESMLTEREKLLLSATSDESFIFDFHVDKSYKQISLWVEKYEFGKLVDEKINHIITDIDKNGTIIFSISKTMDEQESMFNVFVDGAGVSSLQPIKTTEQSTWGSNPAENIPINEKKVLASICYSNGNGMSSLSEDFYMDIENNLNKIKDYDVVYVLRSEFTR